MKKLNNQINLFILLSLGFVLFINFSNLQTSSMNFAYRVYNKGIISEKIHLTSNFEEDYFLEWNITWGRENEDSGWDVAVDLSDNILIVGRTQQPLQEMIGLVKYDNSGKQLWNQTWSEGGSFDAGYGVATDSLDNILVTGVNDVAGEGANIVLIKYDKNGEQLWNRTWDGGNTAEGKGVAVDSSDNIIIAGSMYPSGLDMADIVVIKYNSTGSLLWNHTWSRSDQDEAWGVAVDSLDNIFIIGYSNRPGEVETDMILIKYDKIGYYQWNRTWGGIYGESGLGITVDSSDNIILAGYTSSYGAGGLEDIALVKYNSTGDIFWNCTWGFSNEDMAYGVAVDSLDNVLVAGHTDTSGIEGFNIAMLKYDYNGKLLWNLTWDESNQDESHGIVLDSSNNIILVGAAFDLGAGGNEMCIIKYGSLPRVNINYPLEDEFFGANAPNFNISIIGSNINSTWYDLDGVSTYVKFSGLTGTINQTEWDKIGNGMVTITFYANNSLGSVGQAEVTIRKEVSQQEQEEPIIPGYNIFALLGLCCIITVILIKRRFTK